MNCLTARQTNGGMATTDLTGFINTESIMEVAAIGQPLDGLNAPSILPFYKIVV